MKISRKIVLLLMVAILSGALSMSAYAKVITYTSDNTAAKTTTEKTVSVASKSTKGSNSTGPGSESTIQVEEEVDFAGPTVKKVSLSETYHELYDTYEKQSHADALESIERLREKVESTIDTEIFVADCTKELPSLMPDIIITDVPYGNLVEWNTESSNPLYDMLQQLAHISREGTVLALSMDKKQKVEHPNWVRKKKQIIGKRKFEIYVCEK